MDDWVAVVCKRGHPVRRLVEIAALDEVGKYCPDCGAPVYAACPNCSRQLPIIDLGAPPSPFCIACGLPFPWATREQMILHVQNLLDQVDLDPGDRRALQEQLNEMLQNPSDKETEKRQIKVLQRLQEVVPAFYRDVVVPIVVPLATAYMKQEMKLPPG